MSGEMVWGIARTILAAIGGWFVSKGYVDDSFLTAILGGLGSIFVAAWSVYMKVGMTSVTTASLTPAQQQQK